VDTFKDFDTERSVRKAIEDAVLPTSSSSIVTTPLTDALASELVPMAEALEAIASRLDRLENGR
jgi:hypothetical protein